jgi:hypothetical protein
MGQRPNVLTPFASPQHFLGNEMREARNRIGLSLGKFAAQIRYDSGHMGRCERGERLATPELVAAYDKSTSSHGVLVRYREMIERGATSAELSAVYEAKDRGHVANEASSLVVSPLGAGGSDGGELTLPVFRDGKVETVPMPRRALLGGMGATLLAAMVPPMGSQEPQPRAPETVTPDSLVFLTSVLNQHTAHEPIVGPRYLASATAGYMPMLENLAYHADGPMRTEVVMLATRYTEFCGWLHQDSGDYAAAAYWTQQASDYVQELGDPTLLAYVLQRRSNIASEAEHAGQALSLANAALRQAGGNLPSLIRAVILRQLANAYALMRDWNACAASLDLAFEEVVHGDGRDGGVASYVTPAYLEMESATCRVRLGVELDKAVDTMEASLTHWPAEQERDRGMCLARLATAHALREDPDSAFERGMQALAIAQGTGSARIASELTRLQLQLQPWLRRSDIQHLHSSLNALRTDTAKEPIA